MTRLLCEPEDRLGSAGGNRPSVLSVGPGPSGSTFTMRSTVGLGNDGAEEIKAHKWFAEVDWDSECCIRGFDCRSDWVKSKAVTEC